MLHPLLRIGLIVIQMQAGAVLIAQANIIINDSLAWHGDTLAIKVDNPVGLNLKFSMGDYIIQTEHGKWNNYMDTKERLLGLRMVTDITNIVSFSIRDSFSYLAVVTIEQKKRENDYQAYKVANFLLSKNQDGEYLADDDEPIFSGGEIPIGKLESLTAHITVNGVDSTSWTFYAVKAKGNQWKPPIDLFLTNGVKTFNLYHVSSDAYFDYSHPHPYRKNRPAMGVEFFEGTKALCAVQYDAGVANNLDLGPIQSFGCKAWMLHDLDPNTRIVLVATMSALMLLHNPYLDAQE